MRSSELTLPAGSAKRSSMDERIDGIGGRIGQRLLRVLPLVGATVMAALLSGCISVKAPDKPIVIELNINIKQEVVYKLAADAGSTIEKNPEIF